MLLEQFNEVERDRAIAALRPCVDIARWVEGVADGRPYAGVDDLVARAGAVADPFTAEEVEQALAHHPRIGERAPGQSAEATLSRSEQAGVDPADRAAADALRQGNLAYEERFGRVFLIRAAGRSADEILAQLTERLGNPPAVEDRIVAAQLREIAILRLKGIFTS